MNPLLQGLQISISGIIITFTALALFILVMVVLQKIYPAESEKAKGEAEPEKKMIVEGVAESEDEGAIVAAIAAALSQLQEPFAQSESLGTLLDEGRGTWWMVKRIKANPSVKIKK